MRALITLAVDLDDDMTRASREPLLAACRDNEGVKVLAALGVLVQGGCGTVDIEDVEVVA